MKQELRSVQALEECRFVLVRFYQDGQVKPKPEFFLLFFQIISLM